MAWRRAPGYSGFPSDETRPDRSYSPATRRCAGGDPLVSLMDGLVGMARRRRDTTAGTRAARMALHEGRPHPRGRARGQLRFWEPEPPGQLKFWFMPGISFGPPLDFGHVTIRMGPLVCGGYEPLVCGGDEP
jgi:hypothetical protein